MKQKHFDAVVRELERRKEGKGCDFTHMSDKELEAYRKGLLKEGKEDNR